VAGLKSAVLAGAPDSATRKLVAKELERVVRSREFASSERSCTLLRYLVEHVLDDREHHLKERTIGVELFGRDAAYDTGRDAIVRVSANGVRKRLLAHYATADSASELGGVQIFLPAGSYAPEFRTLPPRQRETAPPPPPDGASLPVSARPAWWRPWPAPAWVAIVVLAAVCGVLVWRNHQLLARVPPAPGMDLLPWSQFGSQKTVTVVLTDANYTIYTDVVDKRGLTLDEYLGEQWTGNFGHLLAPISSRSRNLFTSVVSAVSASRISALLQTTGRTALLIPARRLVMEQLKGEQPVILLGSAIANPWADVFRENLTFAIELEPGTRRQFVANHAPHEGEPARWDPTAAAGSPGTAYAILSLIPNLTGKGSVLLVAGTSVDGTTAAAELLTDTARLRKELLAHGINPAGRVQRFELLLMVQSRGLDALRYQVIAARVG
jgi:hypothetical protein